MKKNNLAFSFVELLIAISIISILSLVAYNGYTSFLDSSNNAKIREDLDSLSLALKNYIKAENKLPDPKGNKNYFDSDSSYIHSSSGAYGVYGQATKTLLDSKYIDFVPKDPRLGTYYSYGKVLDKPEFELAGVLRKDSEYMSLVKSHYSSEIGPVNLIRAYDGPEFVYNGSKLEFPYNPEQKILTAKIRKLSGNLKITQADGTINNINNVSEAEKIDLLEGTRLELSGANSKIEIYFSDGSVSVLEGDGAKMTLDNMKYKQENSLFTSIKLFLESGKLRTKATKLSQNSSFEVGTPDAMTAVRGTIFGVEKNGTTIVKLIKGKIEVTNDSGSKTLSGALKQTEATVSVVETPIDFSLTTQEEKTLNDFGKITKNNRVELVSYSRYGENFEIKLKDLKLANYIKIWTGATEPEPDEESLYYKKNADFIKGNLIVLDNNSFQEKHLSWGKNAPDLNIRLCRTNDDTECTTPPLIVKNINKVDYGVEGSNMKSYEEFFTNTLGDWEIEGDGEILLLTGSNWKKGFGNIINSGSKFVTLKGYNNESRGGIYGYERKSDGELIDNIKDYFGDYTDSNVDYEVSLVLTGSNSINTSQAIDYEIYFSTNMKEEPLSEMYKAYSNKNSNFLYYTSNPEEYYMSGITLADGGTSSGFLSGNENSYFNPNEKKWYKSGHGNYIYYKNNKYYKGVNTLEFGTFYYSFNNQKIKQGEKNIITFKLKETFGEENTKNVLKNLNYIGFNINKTFSGGTNDQTKVTISDFTITKVKKSSVISSSDFHKFAYAPYNRIGDLDLYDEDGKIIKEITKKTNTGATSGILNGETVNTSPKFFKVCDMDSSFAGTSLCQIGGVKGIWIDATDKLYYTGSTNSGIYLNSGSGFVIEMSVRGEDLMRSGEYYLFDSSFNNDNDILYLRNNNGTLYLRNNKKIIIKINSLEKNKFYKIISGAKNKKIFLIIPALNFKKYINVDNNIEIDKLYIGVNNGRSLKDQWNSIIDYVKIYK